MTKENFIKAIEIISSKHSSELKINTPTNSFVGDKLGITEFNLTITKCCATVIELLIDEGFALSVSNAGVIVDKY